MSAGIGTVLVIDDEAAVRDLMQRFLTKEGFRVVTALGGEEGLRLARELRPDAITLDVMMPGMDGWAVLSALKADPDLADIPVIMLTIVDDKNLGYALGASDYLTKPIDRERLVDGAEALPARPPRPRGRRRRRAPAAPPAHARAGGLRGGGGGERTGGPRAPARRDARASSCST